jgi:predicted transcriptional regulator
MMVNTEQVRDLAVQFGKVSSITHDSLTGLRQLSKGLLKMKYAQYGAIDFDAAVQELAQVESKFSDCEERAKKLEKQSYKLARAIDKEAQDGRC